MTPAAQIAFRAGIRDVSPSLARTSTACASTPTTVVCSSVVAAERRERLLSLPRKGFRERAEQAIGGFDEQHFRAAGVGDSIVPVQRVTRELGDLTGHLDSGRAAADDDERQPRLARLRVVLGLGGLEGRQDA